MNLISKHSPEVLALCKKVYGVDTVTISGNRLYFSKRLCLNQGFKEGQKVFFLNEGKDWRFFLDDSDDGFNLTNYAGGNGGINGSLAIYNSGLVRMLEKTLGINQATTYQVIKTTMEQKGNPVFWIITNKKLNS